MLDVEPPHGEVTSWRGFILHLVTITVGLFIALSLEGCVEWAHQRHLVHEARANLQSEIRDNQKSLRDALNDIHSEQKQIAEDIASLKIMVNAPHAHGSVGYRFSNTSLQHASWDTARETGALGFMAYPEVKSYAELYNEQSNFAVQSDRLIETGTKLMTLLLGFQDETAGKEISSAAAREGIQDALAIQAQLLICEAVAKNLDQEYASALKK